MGNLVSKIKGINYKQFAIDHAEKMVLGLVVFFVFMSLIKTSWFPYGHQPEEFLTKVDTEMKALQASTMPAENLDELKKARRIDDLVNELLTEIDASKYEYMTPFFFELYPRKEKRREPLWLTIQDLETTSGHVILALSPSRLYASDEAVDVADNQNNNPAPVAGNNPPPVNPLAPRTGPNPLAPRNGNNPIAPNNDPNGLPNLDPGAPPPAGIDDAPQKSPEGSGYGLRYVSVRGVFPYKEQIEKLAQALHVGSPADAATMFDLINFEVERQVAVAGPDPWNTPWEKVDIEFAIRVLETVTDFDAEVVPTSGTDPVITMPLPMRTAGYWDRDASHSQIAALNNQQREAQRLYEARMVEERNKQQAAEEKFAPVKKDGFFKVVEDVREIQNDIFSGQQGQILREKLRKEIQDETGIDPATVAVAGRILLFRFFDFTVAPGNAYRYRVRLVVRNPNYSKPIEELLDPAFARGQVRETEWSEPSVVAVVPEDVHFYVTKVDPRRQVATVNVYQWYVDSGTTVRAELPKVEVGAEIGGTVKTEVLRPPVSWNEEEVPISTGHTLVDIRSNPRILSRDYPTLVNDLQIESRKGVLLPDYLVAVDDTGELLSMDTETSAVADQSTRSRLEQMQSFYTSLKEEAEEVSRLERERLAGEQGGGANNNKPTRRGSATRRRQK